MFSRVQSKNNKRFSILLFYLIVMIGLIFYGKVFNPAITLEMCLNEPEKYDGKTISIGTEITINKILPDGFTIKQFGQIVKVKGKAENIVPGDYITLIVIFHKDRWLELIDYHVAKKRRFKIFVSIFPALLIIYIFFKTFYFDFKRFEFVERN